MEKIIEHKNNYDNKGTILVNTSDVVHPLSEDDINQLNLFCEKVDKEYISIGDAGESNNLLVGRFMTDKDKPRVVKI